MFDKYLCKKIGKKDISLSDIFDYISSIYGNTLAELSVIGSMFIIVGLICIGARDGFFVMIVIGVLALIIAILVVIVIAFISMRIHVASCPLRKQ